MNRKKRILFVGEGSYLGTGFGTYYGEVLKRLYATQKFEIAELASYCHDGDPRIQQVPWQFYPVQPHPQDVEGQKLFASDVENQFGKWRFDDVCLAWQPDIVMAIRDAWMDTFILQSPLRDYYKYCWMLTIDGLPQRDLWLDYYKQCDGIMSYSEWAQQVMKKYGRPGTNFLSVASPGVDMDVFKPPQNKKEHKKRLGLDPESIIVGTVMRNQKRKLYYDLIETFSKWIYKSKSKGHLALVNKTYLYLHTSYPDVGYDIGKAIREFNIGNKVLMTYICGKCNTVFTSFFEGALTHCRKCGNLEAHCPNAHHGCPRNILADIMKCFDLYVQYSVCLGKNEEILTQSGWKKISEINIGESVFTHKNRYQKVLQKFITPNNGNVKEISIHSDYEKLIVTDNHPCYAYTKEILNSKSKDSVRCILDNMVKLNKKIPAPEWTEVKDLAPNDSVVYCIDDSIIDIDQIDLKEFALDKDIVSDNKIQVCRGDTYPRYIDIDKQFCEFIGLFVADGYSHQKTGELQITYSNNEDYNENLCKNIWKKLANKNASIIPYLDREAKDAQLYSVLYQRALNAWCSRKKDKKLPDWCLYLPNNKTLSILKGLFVGYGHYAAKVKTSKYCTISKTLADQIKHLLRRNRINFNVHIDYRNDDKDGKNRKPQYLFEVPGDIANESFIINQRSSTHNLYYKNYHILKIKEIKNSDYTEDVYNLEVENDNSYETKISVLHNCEGFGMPCADAQCCGTPLAAVDYSAMIDHLQCPTSIPIHVGRYFYEPVIETEQKRALPDNDDFVNSLDKFVKLSYERRCELSKQTREWCEEPCDVYGQETKLPRRSWNRTAAIWHNILNKFPIYDQNQTWLYSKPKLHKIPNPNSIQWPINNYEFVKMVIEKIWQRPDMATKYIIDDWVKSLNMGRRVVGHGLQHINRELVIKHFLQLVEKRNQLEIKRIQMLNHKLNVQKNNHNIKIARV